MKPTFEIAWPVQMITKYFTRVSVRFDPFASSAKPARLFLSRIPLSLKGSCKVDFRVLTPSSQEKPGIEVTFKDKHTLKADPAVMSFKDVATHFDSHSRKLAINEAISE